jgi:hypothetical protein
MLSQVQTKALNAGGTWLDASPRTLVRIASLMTARLDDPGVGLNVVATLSAVPSKLGATPVNSSKVAARAKNGTDPLDRFFGGTHETPPRPNAVSEAAIQPRAAGPRLLGPVS